VEYTASDGLSKPDIGHKSTLFDSKGFLWVGSRGGGLNCFDGSQWINYSEADGLGSSWSKPIFEDHEGGIWFTHAYEKGVSRYINGSFQHFPMQSSVVTELKEGQHWFPYLTRWPTLIYCKKTSGLYTFYVDSSGQLIQYEFDFKNQKFNLEGKPFMDRELFGQYAKYQEIPSRPVYLDWANELCFHTRVDDETHLVYSDGRVKVYPSVHFGGKSICVPDNAGSFQLYKRDTVFTSSKKYDPTKDLTRLLRYDGQSWQELPTPDLPRFGSTYKSPKLSFKQFYTQIDATGKTLLFTIWKVMEKGFESSYLLVEYDSKNEKPARTILLNEEYTLGNIVKDKCGAYWYSNGNGVVRLLPDQLYIPVGFQELPPDVWGVTQSGSGEIWISSYALPGLHFFDGFFLHRPTDKKLKGKSYIRFNNGASSDTEGNVYFTSAAYKKGILKIKPDQSSELLCEGQQGFFLSKDRQDNLLYGTYRNGLWILPKDKVGKDTADWIKINANKGLKLLNVLTVLEDQYGHYWMGRGSQGVATYIPERDTVINWIKEEDKTNYGVQSLEEDAKGNLWLGTDRGLGFFENKKEIGSNLDLKNQLQLVALDYTGSSMIEVCKLYDAATLIVGNSIGYFLLDLDAWYSSPRKLIVYSLTKKEGHQIGGVQQNGVWIDKDKNIWLTCDKGLARYTPKLIRKDTLIPMLTIDSIDLMNGEKIMIREGDDISLKPMQKTFRVYFSYDRNPLLFDNIKYRYRLSKDLNWSALQKQNFIDFANYSPGDYNLEIIAEKNGLQSQNKTLNLHLKHFWWQNPWFWLMGIALGLLVIWYLRSVERKVYHKNLELEKNKVLMANVTKEKEKLQVQTIVNQLNPHFINNALTWLQIRLDDKGDLEGVGVVGKLSENIGMVFKNSRAKKAFHSINDELKITENYLYIQKKRFKKMLNYEMPDAAAVSALEGYDIPLLMIQIHVENAVEHGIRNNPKGGTLKVACKEVNGFAIISIEDDGVGRKVARSIGAHGSQSGTKMLKELQEVYNNQNTQKLTQVYEDAIFTDELGRFHGTRVIISIPKQYNLEL